MKRKHLLGMFTILMVAIVSVGFVSCGDDEDPYEQPVIDEPEPKDYTITLSTTRDFVDLALPSGTKWANMNVGATSNADPGGYYRWGETSEFSKAEYALYNEATSEDVNIGRDISGTKYDVASVLWGDGCKMPTIEQYKELCQYCDYGTYSLSGHSGYVFIGRNGNRIFLPHGGFMSITGIQIFYPNYEDHRTINHNEPDKHYYWSSSDNTEFNSQAWAWHPGFDFGKYNMGRSFGCNVRAIKE